jgi:hypothetical protein
VNCFLGTYAIGDVNRRHNGEFSPVHPERPRRWEPFGSVSAPESPTYIRGSLSMFQAPFPCPGLTHSGCRLLLSGSRLVFSGSRLVFSGCRLHVFIFPADVFRFQAHSSAFRGGALGARTVHPAVHPADLSPGVRRDPRAIASREPPLDPCPAHHGHHESFTFAGI